MEHKTFVSTSHNTMSDYDREKDKDRFDGTNKLVNLIDNPKMELKETVKGRGLFAKELINTGEFISEFDGEIYIGEKEEGWNEDIINHAIQFEPDRWKDSNSLARCANHSCEANCGIKELFKLIAMRDILPGEEITWDYEMTEAGTSDWYLDCKCNSINCRGKIGSYRNLPKEFREKYKGFISEWLIKKYGSS